MEMEIIKIKELMKNNFSNFIYVGHLRDFINDEKEIVGICDFENKYQHFYKLDTFGTNKNSYYIYDIVKFRFCWRIIFIEYSYFDLILRTIFYKNYLKFLGLLIFYVYLLVISGYFLE